MSSARHRLGSRVSGLIHAKPATARKRYEREEAIPLLLNRLADDLMLSHLGDECMHVVAQQVELVHVILFPRMHSNLGRRQTEDQPTVANIYICELQHIAQKCP